MFSICVNFALSYGEIESHSERLPNIKPFLIKYNWKGINNP